MAKQACTFALFFSDAELELAVVELVPVDVELGGPVGHVAASAFPDESMGLRDAVQDVLDLELGQAGDRGEGVGEKEPARRRPQDEEVLSLGVQLPEPFFEGVGKFVGERDTGSVTRSPECEYLVDKQGLPTGGVGDLAGEFRRQVMSGEAGMDQLPDGARGQFTQLLDLHEAVRMLLHPLDQSLHLAFVPRRRSAGTETEHQAHRSLGQAWQEEVQEFKGAQISELDVVDDHKDGAAVAGQLQQGPDKVPGDHSIGQHEAVPRDGTGGHGLLRRFLKGRDRTPRTGHQDRRDVGDCGHGT
ncbi:hypothetical protein ACMZ5A_29035, partial [Bacillus mobilis]|uniref:hypothetical protein n=1 Tax=Bacillus mobilis TaxID=2026190 RepID=UPI0039EFB663